MVGTPRPSNKGPKPSPAEAIARARAVAGPKLEAAAAAASPKVEKAAQAAGSFLSTLRDRAKETAKGFSEGYGTPNETEPGQTVVDQPPAASRPRPRPHQD